MPVVAKKICMQQNRRQKVFGRGPLRHWNIHWLFHRGPLRHWIHRGPLRHWNPQGAFTTLKHPNIHWQKLHWFILFHIFILRFGALFAGENPTGRRDWYASGNILTNLTPNWTQPEKPGPTYNSAYDNQKLTKTERSFGNWTMLRWQNCHQS